MSTSCNVPQERWWMANRSRDASISSSDINSEQQTPMPVNLAQPESSTLFPVAGIRIGTTMAGVRKANRRDLVVFALDEACLLYTSRCV